MALGAEHLSPYQLTIEAGTPFDRAVRRGQWSPPDPDLGARLFETTQAVLGRQGFEAYEVSNHARGEGARSRHNLIYWRGHDYAGVGPGAHGRLTLDGERLATRTPDRAGDYLRQVGERGIGWSLGERLSPRQAAEERLLMGLRTDEGVELAQLTTLGLNADHPAVIDLVDAGLVRLAADRLAATASGRLVLDRITSQLALAETA